LVSGTGNRFVPYPNRSDQLWSPPHGSMFGGGVVLYRRYIGRIVNLTTYLHLVPCVRTSGAIPLFPYMSTWLTKEEL